MYCNVGLGHVRCNTWNVGAILSATFLFSLNLSSYQEFRAFYQEVGKCKTWSCKLNTNNKIWLRINRVFLNISIFSLLCMELKKKDNLGNQDLKYTWVFMYLCFFKRLCKRLKRRWQSSVTKNFAYIAMNKCRFLSTWWECSKYIYLAAVLHW